MKMQLFHMAGAAKFRAVDNYLNTMLPNLFTDMNLFSWL